MHVGVALRRTAEEIPRDAELRRGHRDRRVELCQCRVTERGIGLERDDRRAVRIDRGAVRHDEALVVVERDTAQAQRLHQRGHRLDHLRGLVIRDDDPLLPDRLQHIVG